MTFHQYDNQFRNAANNESIETGLIISDREIFLSFSSNKKSILQLKYWGFMPYVMLENVKDVLSTLNYSTLKKEMMYYKKWNNIPC